MDTQLWIGFGLAALLIIFLIVAFFWGKNLSQQQMIILRLLGAFCAAFAGGLISGSVLVKIDGTLAAGTTYSISGAAGFGLFLIVFFFLPKVTTLTGTDTNLSIPVGWTFQQVVEALVKMDNSVADFPGFTPQELSSKMRTWELHEKTVNDALRRLRSITDPPNAIRPYVVTYGDSTYTLTI